MAREILDELPPIQKAVRTSPIRAEIEEFVSECMEHEGKWLVFDELPVSNAGYRKNLIQEYEGMIVAMRSTGKDEEDNEYAKIYAGYGVEEVGRRGRKPGNKTATKTPGTGTGAGGTGGAKTTTGTKTNAKTTKAKS